MTNAKLANACKKLQARLKGILLREVKGISFCFEE
jgi:hypothetical protein